MMKNLLLTLFTVLLASASFSQTVSISLIAPGPSNTDTVHGQNKISFTAEIENTGSTAIAIGDTIFYWFNFDASTSPISFTGRSGSWSIDILTVALAPGAKLTKTALTGNFTTPPTTPTFNKITVQAAIGRNAAAGAVATASTHYYYIGRSLVSIDEITIEEEVKVYAYAGIINLTSINQENYSYSVYSISGQVISQGTFVNNKDVDMTGAAKGIYAVVVSNGTEKITKKISIQ